MASWKLLRIRYAMHLCQILSLSASHIARLCNSSQEVVICTKTVGIVLNWVIIMALNGSGKYRAMWHQTCYWYKFLSSQGWIYLNQIGELLLGLISNSSSLKGFLMMRLTQPCRHSGAMARPLHCRSPLAFAKLDQLGSALIKICIAQRLHFFFIFVFTHKVRPGLLIIAVLPDFRQKNA